MVKCRSYIFQCFCIKKMSRGYQSLALFSFTFVPECTYFDVDECVYWAVTSLSPFICLSLSIALSPSHSLSLALSPSPSLSLSLYLSLCKIYVLV